MLLSAGCFYLEWPHAYCWLLARVMGMVESVFAIVQQVGPVGQCHSGSQAGSQEGWWGAEWWGHSHSVLRSGCRPSVTMVARYVPRETHSHHIRLSDYSQLWLMLLKACDIQGTLICRKLLLGYETFLSWMFLH